MTPIVLQDAEANKPMSSKKRKRLESYVNKKLKQERRAELFKSLAASQDTLTSSLQLQPSSSLGSRQFKTNQDKLDKVSTLSDRKRSKVLNQVADKKRGYHTDSSEDETNEDEAQRGLQLAAEGLEAGPSRPRNQSATTNGATVPEPKHPVSAAAPSTSSKPELRPVELGSALLRGPDGEIVKPVVRQRQKKAPRVSLQQILPFAR